MWISSNEVDETGANYTCFSAILPNHPTFSLSHRVQKTVLYICVSFAVSHTGLSLPFAMKWWDWMPRSLFFWMFRFFVCLFVLEEDNTFSFISIKSQHFLFQLLQSASTIFYYRSTFKRFSVTLQQAFVSPKQRNIPKFFLK